MVTARHHAAAVAAATIAIVLLARVLPAQDEAAFAFTPWSLRLDADDSELPAAIFAAAARLAAADPATPDAVTGADHSGPLLAWLWLGDDRRARRVLQCELDRAAPDDLECGWTVVHHYWYLRATGDHDGIRAELPRLLQWAERAATARGGNLLADLVLLHATGCCGGILDSLDRAARPSAWRQGPPPDPAGADWARRARERLARFERDHWREHGQRFGEVDAQGPGLWPCWIGMLATTGNKTLLHAGAALASVRAATGWPATPSTLGLARATVAAAQLGADRDRELTELTARLRSTTVRDEPSALGAAIDAALFAVTGVRLATGPGIDEDWLRLRPHLPAGCRRLAILGLHRDGGIVDLELHRRDAEPSPADRERLDRCGFPSAAMPAIVSWLDGRARWQASGATRATRVVLHLANRQVLSIVGDGDELPFASPLPPIERADQRF